MKKVKNKIKLSSKQKKWIKISTISAVGFTTIITPLLVYTITGDQVQKTFIEGGTLGFFIGGSLILWYPISRLLAWMKSRGLKNKNLEKDLELKEAQIQKLTAKSNAKSETNELDTTLFD